MPEKRPPAGYPKLPPPSRPFARPAPTARPAGEPKTPQPVTPFAGTRTQGLTAGVLKPAKTPSGPISNP